MCFDLKVLIVLSEIITFVHKNRSEKWSGKSKGLAIFKAVNKNYNYSMLLILHVIGCCFFSASFHFAVSSVIFDGQ